MSVEVGQKVNGKITGITHFGAFVELPENQSGLVHISEVSNGYVKDINTILEVGEEVAVKVLSIADDGKIRLSIRQATETPVQDEKSTRSNSPRRSQNHDKFSRGKESGDYQRQDTTRGYQPKESMAAASTNAQRTTSDFDQLMSNFLKDSEDRLTSLKRNTEGKRGGRGGRRS